MKKGIVLCFFVLMHLSFKGVCQDEMEYEIQTSEKIDKIVKSGFSLSIYEIISNPYNQKANSLGSSFVEINGCRLAEGLKILSNYGGKPLMVENLRSNPYIMWRIDLNEGVDFRNKYEEVLMELSKYYKFSVAKESKNYPKYSMKVSNRELLNKYLTKSIKKGVLGEFSKKKSGDFMVTHANLNFLVKWLEDNFFIRFEPVEIKENRFYDFRFANKNLDEIISDLKNKYGIDIQSKQVKETLFTIK
jgi:hypothetical protein